MGYTKKDADGMAFCVRDTCPIDASSWILCAPHQSESTCNPCAPVVLVCSDAFFCNRFSVCKTRSEPVVFNGDRARPKVFAAQGSDGPLTRRWTRRAFSFDCADYIPADE